MGSDRRLAPVGAASFSLYDGSRRGGCQAPFLVFLLPLAILGKPVREVASMVTSIRVSRSPIRLNRSLAMSVFNDRLRAALHRTILAELVKQGVATMEGQQYTRQLVERERPGWVKALAIGDPVTTASSGRDSLWQRLHLRESVAGRKKALPGWAGCLRDRPGPLRSPVRIRAPLMSRRPSAVPVRALLMEHPGERAPCRRCRNRGAVARRRGGRR